MKLTKEECEEIRDKIDSEGFDYYFNDYGPDEKLDQLISKEIGIYKDARSKLFEVLAKLGIEVEY